jgi:hypothetical protein
MAAVLHLVHPIDHTEQFMSRVFTEEFASRLEAVNRVARELRALGYRVVRETLYPGQTDRPTIEVEPGTVRQVQPLVELGHGRTVENMPDGSRCCSIHRDGVRVMWREVLRSREQTQ